MRYLFVLAIFAGLAVSVHAQQRAPHIGYAFPAGGQAGSTFEVVVGGQYLRGVNGVHFSGAGLSGEVVEHYPPARNIRKEERVVLQSALQEQWAKQVQNMPQETRQQLWKIRQFGGMMFAGEKMRMQDAEADVETAKMPEHYLLRNLETKTPHELLNIPYQLFRLRDKRQPNTQIADTVVVKITIAEDAEPGRRSLRLSTPRGLTNPVFFQVGTVPEAREQEPDAEHVTAVLPAAPLEPPVLVNGQIMPGDVDRLRFRARKGEQLVLAVQARELIPYLADAVPGWFQAVLIIRDGTGKEVAYADDNAFHPDPVIHFKAPHSGVFTAEVRDSIYRGREDFVYRLRIAPPTADDEAWFRHDAAAVPENEPNNSVAEADPVTLPYLMSGCIDSPEDRDWVCFEGELGQSVVVAVKARVKGSPLDSLVRVLDSRGNVLAWNDDYSEKTADHLHLGPGLLTHHADSYLQLTLPEAGRFFVQISDAQRQGSPEHQYDVRISQPQPDFSLRVTPSTLSLMPGQSAVVTVYAQRQEGFAGDIGISVAGDEGITVHGGTVPAGCSSVRMTLQAPGKGFEKPVAVQLTGTAEVAGRAVTRSVRPAEDMMQAFLFRHLLPVDDLMLSVPVRRWRMPSPAVVGASQIKLSPGGTASVRIRGFNERFLGQLEVELNNPPAGVSISKVVKDRSSLTLEFAAAPEMAVDAGLENLIVDLYRTPPPRKQDDKRRIAGRRHIGVLPALPVTVVRSE